MGVAVTSLKRLILYRALSLRYHHMAASAVGARKVAGRFNRHGRSALYLSLEPETALAEYWGGFIRPAVIVPFTFTSDRLVDLRADTSGMAPHWQDWKCDWKDSRERRDGGDMSADCASWRCFDDAVARNLTGIVYPSIRKAGGTNLVLFVDDAVTGTWICAPLDPQSEIAEGKPPIVA